MFVSRPLMNTKLLLALPLLTCLIFVSYSQKPAAKAKATSKSVVFAVLDDGKRIEPIVSVENGKIVESIGEGEAAAKTWSSRNYKPKTVYPVIFGGAFDGGVTVIKSNIGTECGGSSAETSLKPANPKLRGLVMALATDLKPKEGSTSYRRRPTPAERTELEKLVRDEFTKQGVTPAPLKNLRYHNLTALDLNGDDVAEFVGSFWIAPTPKERRLLFFIAERAADEKLSFPVSDYSAVKPDDVMSGEVGDVDS